MIESKLCSIKQHACHNHGLNERAKHDVIALSDHITWSQKPTSLDADAASCATGRAAKDSDIIQWLAAIYKLRVL